MSIQLGTTMMLKFSYFSVMAIPTCKLSVVAALSAVRARSAVPLLNVFALLSRVLRCDRYTFAVVEPYDKDDILMPSAFWMEVCLTDTDSLQVGR